MFTAAQINEEIVRMHSAGINFTYEWGTDGSIAALSAYTRLSRVGASFALPRRDRKAMFLAAHKTVKWVADMSVAAQIKAAEAEIEALGNAMVDAWKGIGYIVDDCPEVRTAQAEASRCQARIEEKENLILILTRFA